MPRKSYLSYLWSELRHGGVRAPFRVVWRGISPPLTYFSGRAFPGPLHAIFIPTYQCNLRCLRCELVHRPAHAKEEGKKLLSVPEVETAIDELASIGASGLGFTGGEPLVCPETLHYLKYAKERGLLTQLSTNGLLVNEEMTQALLDSRVDSVSMSIDGLDAATHDKLRNSEGSFEGTLRAMELLSRKRKEGKPRIIVVTVLCEANLHQIRQIAEMVLSHGADYFGLIPEHDSALMAKGDKSCLALPSERIEEADRAIDEIIQMAGTTDQIDSSLPYLRGMKRCIRGQGMPFPCYAGSVTLALDCYGDIYPCFGLVQAGFEGPNIREISLRDYWRSKELKTLRRTLRGCRLCYWNCQAELNLLYSPKAWLGR